MLFPLLSFETFASPKAAGTSGELRNATDYAPPKTIVNNARDKNELRNPEQDAPFTNIDALLQQIFACKSIHGRNQSAELCLAPSCALKYHKPFPRLPHSIIRDNQTAKPAIENRIREARINKQNSELYLGCRGQPDLSARRKRLVEDCRHRARYFSDPAGRHAGQVSETLA